MAKDKDTTKVVFRKFKDDEIIALFPEIDEVGGTIMSYMHVGQHGYASRLIVADTKLATPEEYGPLFMELEVIGYRLAVRKRITL
jgi:hypothetical protein